jgi:hypothetical protein
MPDLYSTDPLPHLLARWARGELTVEQLAGYLLQHVLRHDQRLDQLEKALGRAKGNSPEGGVMRAS